MDPAPDPTHARGLTLRFILVAVVTAAAVGLFWWRSQYSDLAVSRFYPAPPVYGAVRPVFPPVAWAALAAALVTAVLVAALRRRWPTGAMLAAALGGVGFSLLLNLERGSVWILNQLWITRDYPDYGADVPLRRSLGLHRWVSEYPHIRAQMKSVHTRTHPPGAVVTFDWLLRVFGGRWMTAVVMATLTLGAAVAAWAITRARFEAGSDAGVAAAALVALSPGIAIFAFTSMDGVYAGVLSTCAAVLFTAVRRRSWLLALIGGFLLGLSTFLTYAGAFVGLALALYALAQVRPLRTLARIGAAAVGGGLLALVLLRLSVGFDLLACYGSVTKAGLGTDRSAAYWAIATPMVYLIYAGLPLAALAVMRLGSRRPPLLPLALLGPMLVFATLPPRVTGLLPGEIERTWLFTLPVFAALGVDLLIRWERSSTLARRYALPVLMVVSAAQAVLIESIYQTVW